MQQQDQIIEQTFTAAYGGEDRFDVSWDIEDIHADPLGKVGLGHGEAIKEGPPVQFVSFKVWLFDKNAIRTVTKVLMSKYAFEDDEVRAYLAGKGASVLAEPGVTTILETKRLRVDVVIDEVEYSEDETVPRESYFTKLTVRLTPSQKEAPAP